ncbi:MAG TPA: hypothetical protein DDW68_03055 [Verrucomicrobiales bacterium]|nr:hypothetical protein [Verrucomicrobiales bacterium]
MRIFSRPLAALTIFATSLIFSSCGPFPTPSGSYTPSPRVAFKTLVTIRNNSDKSIMLGLRGPETKFISLPARGSRTVSLSSGLYKYAATTKNTNTISGYKSFGRDSRYTWSFSVN